MVIKKNFKHINLATASQNELTTAETINRPPAPTTQVVPIRITTNVEKERKKEITITPSRSNLLRIALIAPSMRLPPCDQYDALDKGLSTTTAPGFTA
jgi:hypothetical protein